MTLFRVRFTVAGGHVHCRLFVGKHPNQTFAKAGEFCVSKGEEFRALVNDFRNAQFIGDNPDVGIAEASRD